MAEKNKKGKGAAKAAPAKAEEAVKSEKADKVERSSEKEHDSHADDADHGHADHGHGDHGAAAAHGHAPNYREYFMVFGVLTVLTALEVAVAQIPGISRTLVALALIGLAVTKAACVGFFYMHLKHETKILKYTVALPMIAPPFYALVLIAEAAWRLAR